MPEVKAKI